MRVAFSKRTHTHTTKSVGTEYKESILQKSTKNVLLHIKLINKSEQKSKSIAATFFKDVHLYIIFNLYHFFSLFIIGYYILLNLSLKFMITFLCVVPQREK